MKKHILVLIICFSCSVAWGEHEWSELSEPRHELESTWDSSIRIDRVLAERIVKLQKEINKINHRLDIIFNSGNAIKMSVDLIDDTKKEIESLKGMVMSQQQLIEQYGIELDILRCDIVELESSKEKYPLREDDLHFKYGLYTEGGMINTKQLIEDGHMNPEDVIIEMSVHQGEGVRSGYIRIKPGGQTENNIKEQIKKISGSSMRSLLKDLKINK